MAGFRTQATASVILAPQNHSDLAHFDGQNNFAIFTRMKQTTKQNATAQYINRYRQLEKIYDNAKNKHIIDIFVEM